MPNPSHSFTHEPSFTVAGLCITTSNTQAFDTIPRHWATFMSQGAVAQIPDRISDEIYAVYSGFDRTPSSAQDVLALGYTFTIGARVSGKSRLPGPFSSVVVPAAKRAVFDVLPAVPERVGEHWQAIWKMSDLPRIFAPDYEHYAADGSIRILISVT